MATTVYNTEEIVLSDGTPLTLRPLPVKYLRKVLTKFGEYTKSLNEAIKSDEADAYDPDGIKLVDNITACSVIALEGYKVAVEDPEEVLDIETMYKILEIGADINLRENRNLANQALEAAGQN